MPSTGVTRDFQRRSGGKKRGARSPRLAAAVEPHRLWPACVRLRAWNRLSLYFVPRNRRDDAGDHVPTTDGETTVALRQIGEREATVNPWPFDQENVHLPVLVTRVPDKRYQSDEQFLATYLAEKPEVWDYTLQAPR